jgi:SPP1 gp7 family putative phage head morphogenesis protein
MAILPLTRRGEFLGWGLKMPKTEGEFTRLYRAMKKVGRSQQEEFAKAHNAATSYGRALRSIASQVQAIMEDHMPESGVWGPGELARLDAALRSYAEAIEPWARAVAWRMVKEVNRRNWSAWNTLAQEMGAALRYELASTPLGGAVDGLLAQQVDLITSLPRDASQRVHEASLEAQITAARYPEREAQIREDLAKAHPAATARWLKHRATLIARTETARSASVLTEARARGIGANQYVWKTAQDWKVRPSHRRLNNTVHSWDDPPLSDPPDHHSHPGQIFNCRCVALPIIPGQ